MKTLMLRNNEEISLMIIVDGWEYCIAPLGHVVLAPLGSLAIFAGWWWTL